MSKNVLDLDNKLKNNDIFGIYHFTNLKISDIIIKKGVI